MTIGIWTPVAGSTVQLVFGDRLNTFANKLRTTALVAGTHMLIKVMGCEPVYVHSSAPADDTAGLTGTPVGPCVEYVLPRTTNVWIYSPYENSTVLISVGAMT